MIEPTKELLDDIFRRRVLQARKTSPEQRVLDSLWLYQQSLITVRDGIRDRFPDADDSEVERILHQQLKRTRELEERGIYHPVEESDNDG